MSSLSVKSYPKSTPTHLFDQAPRDRMKRLFIPLIRLHRQSPIDGRHRPQDRSTKLHATLDDTRPVRANDPPSRIRGIRPRRRTRHTRAQRHLIEPQPQLSIRRLHEPIHRAEMIDVRAREGRDLLGLKTFEKDDCRMSVDAGA